MPDPPGQAEHSNMDEQAEEDEEEEEEEDSPLKLRKFLEENGKIIVTSLLKADSDKFQLRPRISSRRRTWCRPLRQMEAGAGWCAPPASSAT